MTQACDHDQPLDLDQELRIADRALHVEGNPEHARTHLACAVFAAPVDARVHALFNEWWSLANAELRQSASEKPNWTGDLLLMALIRAHQGDLAGAIRTALQSLAYGAPVDSVLLAGQWWQSLIARARNGSVTADALIEQLALGSVMRAVVEAGSEAEQDAADRSTLLSAFDDFLDQVDQFAQLHCESKVAWSGPTLLMRVRTKRAAGRLEPALKLAERYEACVPSYETAVAVAACHRDLEDIDAALRSNWLAA